jgi:hypothetical protein
MLQSLLHSICIGYAFCCCKLFTLHFQNDQAYYQECTFTPFYEIYSWSRSYKTFLNYKYLLFLLQMNRKLFLFKIELCIVQA